MSVLSKSLSLMCCGVLIGGCYVGGEQQGETQERLLELNTVVYNGTFFNGPFFNTAFFNGTFFNGPFFNGPFFNTDGNSNSFFNGTRLDQLTLNGEEVEDLALEGSSLSVVQMVDGEKVVRVGDEVVGMVISLTVEGTAVGDEDPDPEITEIPVALRIDDAMFDPEAATDDVMLYYVSVEIGGNGEWANPCVDSEGIDQPVIFLKNYWDEETGDRIDDDEVLTMACTTGVLAHCTQWGYRPWGEAVSCKKKGKKKGKKKKCKEVSLVDHHQACTRMARADYCGDGVSWTTPGTLIDVWDNLTPQINARTVEWEIEAEWTPDGAWCLNDIRQQGWKDEGLYPSCSKRQDKKWKRRAHKCGKLKNKHSLMVSSFDLSEFDEDDED